MFYRKLVFCLLFVCLAVPAFAQSSNGTTIPLIVDNGFPLQVILNEKLNFHENEVVHARVIEPVYSFDREVIPAGSQLEGTITAFHNPTKWKRISAMLGGNFSSLREPQITFHALVLAGGKRVPIEAAVLPGTEKVVRSGNTQESELRNSFTSTAKKSQKEQLKTALWKLAPYHPQYAPAGTRLSAVLLMPIDFGEAVFEDEALGEIGSVPPSGSVVTVRLVTPLDSRTTQPGTQVEAQLIRPLFSANRRLIFPVGSRVRGSVTEVDPARTRHHNGKLTFSLTTISPPDSLVWVNLHPQEVEGRLVSVRVDHEMKDLHIKDMNTARIVESKKRWISAAWSFVKAERSFGSTADPLDTAILGAYRGKFLKQVTGGHESEFGLPASISGAMIPAVGIGLGFYGVARSVYSNFLGPGRDIYLPNGTAMEIQLEKQPQVTR